MDLCLVLKKQPFLLNGSIPPEILEPARCQLGVANCMLYVPMPHVVLNRPGIMPLARQIEPGRVAQHVGMDRELDAGQLAGPRNHLAHG